MKIPNFFLLSRNIQFVLEKNSEFLEDVSQVQLLSNMIGVPVEDIVSYVRERKEKEAVKSGKKQTVQSFSEGIGKLSIPQIKYALDKFLIKNYTRQQNNKADLLLLLSAALKERGLDENNFVENFNSY